MTVAFPGVIAASRRRTPAGNPYALAVLADSPLLYLRLEETSGSSCANAGSLGGTATCNGTFTRNITGATTNLGVAVDLAGSTSDYISYPDTASLDITGDVTYECWAKFDSYSAANNLLTKGRDGDFTGGYQLRVLSSGAIQVQRAQIALVLASSTGVLVDTNWHHVAFTRSGNNYVIYLDGSSVASGSSSEAIQATTKPFLVGIVQTEFGFQNPLDGKVDEVAIYNTALSSGRISAHYAART